MNDTARNSRTLIVSFVVAIMALIPLRFVEVGQSIVPMPQVLGDETYYEEVVMPYDAPIEEFVLEAPYNEIEQMEVLGETEELVAESYDCIPEYEVKSTLSEYEDTLSGGGLDGETIDALVSEMIAIEAAMCR